MVQQYLNKLQSTCRPLPRTCSCGTNLNPTLSRASHRPASRYACPSAACFRLTRRFDTASASRARVAFSVTAARFFAPACSLVLASPETNLSLTVPLDAMLRWSWARSAARFASRLSTRSFISSSALCVRSLSSCFSWRASHCRESRSSCFERSWSAAIRGPKSA